jgi:hypothetical protein
VADTVISDLTAASAGILTHEFPANEAGVTKKVTGDLLVGLNIQFSSVSAASTSTPGAGFAADTYLAGSRCLVPAATGRGSLKVQSMYRCKFSVSKTAAGAATPIITVRYGTAGTTSDTSIGSLTFAAQTAAIDEGFFEIYCTWRTVGSGTSGTMIPVGTLVHRLPATGLSTSSTSVIVGSVGAGHNTQTAGAGVGCSVNGGTSAAWTIALVQAELFNLA